MFLQSKSVTVVGGILVNDLTIVTYVISVAKKCVISFSIEQIKEHSAPANFIIIESRPSTITMCLHKSS